MFNGEIGNAAPGIELIGYWKGVCRANIKARMATAAVINLRLIGGKITLVNIVPIKNHEPNSRESKFVCLPCQPNPAV